jgi:hypothetical protein
MIRPSSATKRHAPIPITTPSLSSSAGHAAVPGSNNILVTSITVRRVNIPPGPAKEFVATIHLALTTDQASSNSASSLFAVPTLRSGSSSSGAGAAHKITTAPEKAQPDFTSGWTINFRDLNFILPLHAMYDTRNGVHVSVQSTCGSVQLGTANCRQSREWFFLSKPRGEVQVSFTEAFGSSPGLSGNTNNNSSSASTAGSSLVGARPMSGAAARHAPTSSSSSDGQMISSSASGAGGTPILQAPVPAGNQQPSNRVLATSIGFSPRQITTAVQSRSVDFTNISVTNFMCSRDPEEYFLLQVQFAGQTKQIPAALGTYDPVTGHNVTWSPKLNAFLIFDIPLYIKESVATFSLYRGTSLAEGLLAAQTSVTIDTTEPSLDTLSLQLAGRSVLTVTVNTRFREPQKEGAGGRPTSAFSRGGGGNAPAPSVASGLIGVVEARPPLGALTSSSSAGKAPTTPPAQRSHGRAGGQRHAPGGNYAGCDDDGEDDDDGYIIDDDDAAISPEDDTRFYRGTAAGASAFSADVDHLIAGLLSRVDASIAKAFAPVEQRLEEIEARVAQGEERITAYLAACAAGQQGGTSSIGVGGSGSISPTPVLLGSRPASGDSIASSSNRGYSGVAFTSFPEHSNPLFNESMLQAKFDGYDTHRRGYISRSQLIHFYRTHNSFAYDATDDDVMEALAELARNFDTEHVSFDCFCAIALKLAKS